MPQFKHLFNDVVEELDGAWAVVCRPCAYQLNVEGATISGDKGAIGTCGVRGCQDAAHTYIEFDEEDK